MTTLFRRGRRLLLGAGATALVATALSSSAASADATPRLGTGAADAALPIEGSVGTLTGAVSGASIPELQASYSTIDFPGAATTVATDVIRTGPIGAAAEVVGWYEDEQGYHGFVMSGGHYQALDFPGADETQATGINDRGQIVGVYHSPQTSGGLCSFLYSAGTYSTILTGCPRFYSYNLQANGINDSDEIVANYLNVNEQKFSGALNIAGNNEFGYTYPGSTNVYLNGINNNPVPEMVGYYTDSQSHAHGLVFHGTESGSGTSFDVPGAAATLAWDVNDTGQIVGIYGPPNSYHGFVDDGGSFKGIDFPGSHFTFAFGIDNRSGLNGRYDVVGYYRSSTGVDHAYIATVSNIAATRTAG